MPHVPDTFVYGIIVGLVSAFGAVFASRIASRAARTSAGTALLGVSGQIEYQIAERLAEFRQSRINELRDCMAELQSYGVTPDIDHSHDREFYKFGTKIELLMNREDPRYQMLQDRMYQFLEAESTAEKFACNAPYIEVCQEILKSQWEDLEKDLVSSSVIRPNPAN